MPLMNKELDEDTLRIMEKGLKNNDFSKKIAASIVKFLLLFSPEQRMILEEEEKNRKMNFDRSKNAMKRQQN